MIYLFGSTGMLGTYVKKILSDTLNITDITRKEYDILNDEWDKLYKLLSNLNKNDVIINCAGIIPQKENLQEYEKYIKINSLQPIVFLMEKKIIHMMKMIPIQKKTFMEFLNHKESQKTQLLLEHLLLEKKQTEKKVY